MLLLGQYPRLQVLPFRILHASCHSFQAADFLQRNQLKPCGDSFVFDCSPVAALNPLQLLPFWLFCVSVWVCLYAPYSGTSCASCTWLKVWGVFSHNFLHIIDQRCINMCFVTQMLFTRPFSIHSYNKSLATGVSFCKNL